MTPDGLRQQARRAFEDMGVGQRFVYRRTFTDGDVALFCGVTGDFNPHHQDAEFCASTRFGRPIIPGLLTASMLTHIGGLLGFLASDMHFEFLAPVYPGDTIRCIVEVIAKDERRVHGEGTFTNQDGTLVLKGRFSGVPTQVRLAPSPLPEGGGG